MDESNALFMARRVMQRNLERAQDLQSVCNNDLVRSIVMESAAWLTDFGEDRDKGISDYLKKQGEIEAAELWDKLNADKLPDVLKVGKRKFKRLSAK